MIDSRRLSATLPSTDPVDQRDSLAAAEERIARKTRAAVRRIVVGAYEAWLDTLTAAGDMGAFDGIPGEWEQFVNGELADDIGAVFDDGALSTWATLPEVAQAVGSLADGWMTVVNESAVSYQMQATNRLRGVGETMWNDVKQIVARGVQAGENNEELKQRIERVTGFSEFRADTIARTETIAAYNGGNASSAEALGDFGPTEKVWLAGIDARTRPTHVEANNQTVPFSSPFIVGGVEMMRPHDPGSPAREVVNCRCIMQVLYPGDLRPDGTVVPERDSTAAVAEAEGIPVVDSEDMLSELVGEERVGSVDPLPMQSRLRDMLTDDELDSINIYTGNAYEDINLALRFDRALDTAQAKVVRDLDAVIAKAGRADEPFIVYRGMTLPNPDVPGFGLLDDTDKIRLVNEMIEQRYQPGARMTFGGQFASASTDVAAPIDAALSRQNRGVVFEVLARRGAPINDVSRYSDEFEVVLPRNQAYQIVRVERDVEFYDFTNDRTSTRTVVQLREVD